VHAWPAQPRHGGCYRQPAVTPVAERLRIEDVGWSVGDAVVVARVRLSYQGRQASGLASLSGEGLWREAVAEATLRAVRVFVADASEVFLDAVTEVRSGRYPLVVVTMTAGRRPGGAFLSGTAVLRDDGGWAVARAVLHGLNRWVDARLSTDGDPPTAEADVNPGRLRAPT
jgi:hypothetical protein